MDCPAWLQAPDTPYSSDLFCSLGKGPGSPGRLDSRVPMQGCQEVRLGPGGLAAADFPKVSTQTCARLQKQALSSSTCQTLLGHFFDSWVCSCCGFHSDLTCLQVLGAGRGCTGLGRVDHSLGGKATGALRGMGPDPETT